MATKYDLLSTLRSVQAGSITPEEALLQMKLAPFEDLGYAKVDYHRAVRQGASEVIYGRYSGSDAAARQHQYSGNTHRTEDGGLVGGAVSPAL